MSGKDKIDDSLSSDLKMSPEDIIYAKALGEKLDSEFTGEEKPVLEIIREKDPVKRDMTFDDIKIEDKPKLEVIRIDGSPLKRDEETFENENKLIVKRLDEASLSVFKEEAKEEKLELVRHEALESPSDIEQTKENIHLDIARESEEGLDKKDQKEAWPSFLSDKAVLKDDNLADAQKVNEKAMENIEEEQINNQVKISEEPETVQVETEVEELEQKEEEENDLEQTQYININRMKRDLAEAQEEEDEEYEEDYTDEDQYHEVKTGFFKGLLNFFGNLIFIIFMLAISAVIVLNLYSYVTGARPSVMGYSAFIVGENSLEPAIKENDLIIVKKPTNTNEIKEGQLLVYEGMEDDSVITAWMTRKLDDTSFEVKKDLKKDAATVVDMESIIGVGNYRIAKMGTFIEFISNPIGIAVVFLLGVIIYLLMWMIGRKFN